jgi:dimethylamine corrinoid protein
LPREGSRNLGIQESREDNRGRGRKDEGGGCCVRTPCEYDSGLNEPTELLQRLAEAVVAMKPERVAELARQALEQGIPADEAITNGLAAGMRRMGERYAAKQCFVPEVLLASKAMYAGFDILSKATSHKPQASRGKVILGVVQGDIHDIGKNIVKVMVQAAGFEIVDLGRNVALPEFVKAAAREVNQLGTRSEASDDSVMSRGPSLVLGMSSLMTTTMPRMGKVIELLDKEGLRSQVKVMVGGAPTTAEFARRIGADAWAADAHSAVLEIERLVGEGTEKSRSPGIE